MTSRLKEVKMYELIYAGKEVEDIIKKKYPNAEVKDASDYIHTERFEVEIPGITDDEFYPLAIKEGFIKCCLGFEILFESLRFKETKTIKPNENLVRIQKWVELAKNDS